MVATGDGLFGTTVKVARNFADHADGAQVATYGGSRLVQMAPVNRLVAFDADLTAVCMMWSPQDGRAYDRGRRNTQRKTQGLPRPTLRKRHHRRLHKHLIFA